MINNVSCLVRVTTDSGQYKTDFTLTRRKLRVSSHEIKKRIMKIKINNAPFLPFFKAAHGCIGVTYTSKTSLTATHILSIFSET